jgi:hypothetical protein
MKKKIFMQFSCFSREISLSFMEIYLEEVRDLLNPDGRNLMIREDSVNIKFDRVVKLRSSHSSCFKSTSQGHWRALRSRSRYSSNRESKPSHTVGERRSDVQSYGISGTVANMRTPGGIFSNYFF